VQRTLRALDGQRLALVLGSLPNRLPKGPMKLPGPGTLFLMPLEGGSFGACRVLRHATEAEAERLRGPAVLEAEKLT
jgi:hypothetical protein